MKLIRVSVARRAPFKWWLPFYSRVVRRLSKSTGYVVPGGVVRRDLRVCVAAAVIMLVLWTCQYYFEGRVNNSALQWSKENCVEKLRTYAQIAPTPEDSEAAQQLIRILDSLPSFEMAESQLPSNLAQGAASRLDAFIKSCLSPATVAMATELRFTLGNGVHRAVAPGFVPPFWFWLLNVVFSFSYGAVLLIVTTRLQAARRTEIEEGRLFTCSPIPLVIYGSFLITTFVVFLVGWHRDIGSDVYWMWGIALGAVLTAYASAKDRPIFRSELSLVADALTRPDSGQARALIDWLKTRIDHERWIAGWVLSIAYTLGSTLLFGAASLQTGRLTTEGIRVLYVEYALISACCWVLGVNGIFLRYLKRVKILQEVLRGPIPQLSRESDINL